MEDGNDIGIYEVCEWLIETYPQEIFTTEMGHPVSKMRDLAIKIITKKTKK